MNLCVATMGRISKEDIMRSIEKPLPYQSGLCTYEHVSYQGFAKDHKLEYITLKADFNQHVKQSVYHIEMSIPYTTDSKNWVVHTFWGVSTKYPQNYLGWFSWNEKLKKSGTYLKDFTFKTVQDTNILKGYNYIGVTYQWLLSTQ